MADAAPSVTLTRPTDAGDLGLFAHLVEVAKRQDAKHPAIICANRVFTYPDLVEAAAEFCDNLAASGVQPGDPVAVLLGNCAEFLIAAFAAWKRGAVLVPLNERLQEREILRYISDVGAHTVIANVRKLPLITAMRESGGALATAWLCAPEEGGWTSTTWAEPAAAPPAGGPATPRRGDAAIMQFSTGSTGIPKRVTRTHGHLVDEFTAVSSVLAITPADSVLGVAPFFHSHGLMNAAMQAILSGATLHPVDNFFPKDIARLIEQRRITYFPGVPFMFQNLAELRQRFDLSSVRLAISAGAPLPPETAQAVLDAFGITIRALYGSTETGVVSIARDGAARPTGGSVGHAVPGVEVTIEDAIGHRVDDGEVGRVRIVSPFAAARYDTTPGNSESHFTGDAFYPGDRGSIAGGEITLVGRDRGFINVGGNKVDPTEVEVALREMPGVAEAVVFGMPDGAAGEKIKAVLVADERLSQADVRTYCTSRLAEYKRPRIIEFRKELPKSPLGKILRKYLVDESLGAAPLFTFDARLGFRNLAPGTPPPTDTAFMHVVPPFLRVLLVTDGTVTKSLEAFFWEPIDVEVLAHEHRQSATDEPDLGIVSGEPVLLRRVLLRGRVSQTVYAFAGSVIACKAIPAELLEQLIANVKGIGELLRQERRGTYRELLNVRSADAGDWAEYLMVGRSDRVALRTYRIFYRDLPAIRIEEIFPVHRFEAKE